MAIVPLAIQTFANFDKYYLSFRNAPNTWNLQATIFTGGAVGRASCSSGAVTPALVTKQGIVRGSTTDGSILFLGNGLPASPQTIQNTSNLYDVPDFWDIAQGAWWFNNAWWVVLQDDNPTHNNLSIWSSTDPAGTTGTWNQIDSTHQPNPTTSDGVYALSFDTVAGILHVFGISGNTEQYSLWDFTISGVGTGSWSAAFGFIDFGKVIRVGAGLATGKSCSNGIIKYANGDTGVFYADASFGNCYYRLFAGGTWGAEITIGTSGMSGSAAFANVIQDASNPDLLHYFYYPNWASGSHSARKSAIYGQVTHTGTVTTNLFTFTSVGESDGIGRGLIAGGQIFVPYDDQADQGGGTFLGNSVYVAPLPYNVGTPFTAEFLPRPVGEAGNPPSCTFLIFGENGITPPAGQTLELLKIVQGGPASPADFTLSATGGSPEVGISGPGPQVGPTAVNPGVFELGEIAPGGATWDAATSTWDGTTVWDGGGDYSVVWNCNAPMPTPTSVTVASGGGPSTVTPVQVPNTDPTFRSLLSGGRFEFATGGNVYQVGWTSNNKIGMFMRPENEPGAAWAEQDAFGSPEQGDQSGYGKATLVGAIISVCYLRIGRTEAVICIFNTITNTWGSPTTALVVESQLTTFGFVQQSSGTYVLIGGGANHFYVATNTLGVWAPIQNLILNKTQVLDACVDSADAIHVLLISVSLGTEYRRLDPVTYAPSSPTGILASTSLTLGGYPTIIPWGASSIAITGVDQFGVPAFKVQVFIGTPLAAPSFTTYVIATPSSETFTFPKVAQAIDGTLHNFYVDDAGGGAITVKQSDFDGVSVWSAPGTFYDAMANPPNFGVPAASQQISALDPVNIESGSPLIAHWAIGSAMETLQPTEVTTAQVIEASSAQSAVVCTATNIFTGPPPGPPGPGQMNPVGCFELLRVDISLMPARHLPVRGSVK